MKRFVLVFAAVFVSFVSQSTEAAVTLGLSSVKDATIKFTGTGSQATINFTNGQGGFGFGIRTVEGSVGGVPDGLFGTISARLRT